MFSVNVFFLCHVAFVSAAAGDTLESVQRHTASHLSKASAAFLEVAKTTVASVESDFQVPASEPAAGNSLSELKQETLKANETLKDETNGAKDTPPGSGVNVITNTDVNVNIGAGSGNSPVLAGGGGNYSMGSAASGRTFSGAPGKYGSPFCPCIGFDGVKGFIDFSKNHKGEGRTAQDTLIWETVPQDADYGAHCDDWARQGDQSSDDQKKSQSGSKWCFIDAHNCDWNSLPDVPKRSLVFPQARWQDHGIFYSYATCGDVDKWTETHNQDACPLKKSKQDCDKESQVAGGGTVRKCAWLEEYKLSFKGSGKEIKCLAKDLIHVDQSKKQVEMLQDGVPKWGKPSCKCIGMAKGLNQRTYTAKTGKLDRVEEFDIPGRTGATCGAWDMPDLAEGSKGHPFCQPKNGTTIPDWCSKKWCYVDGCDCNGLLVSPKVTTYFRDGGSYQGHTIYYSYSTCAGDKESGETNTYTTKEWAPQSCSVQESEADCNSAITLGRCTWVPTASGGGKCKGTELVNKEACNLK